MLAAPSSAAGKSTLTIGLLAAFARCGAVRAAKCGPDYIDPMFHALASGAPSVNLDPWAMPPAMLRGLAAAQSAEADLLLIEGVMGLFDGAAGGGGSTADLAATLGLPVVLVLDAAHQAQSAAALVRGFDTHRDDIRISGVILNRVGSARHAGLIRGALAPLDIPVVGAVPRRADLAMPSRHLGLVPAAEVEGVRRAIDALGDLIAECVDLDSLERLARPLAEASAPQALPPLPPLGQRVAVARDIAFCFAYPHLLDGWRRAGAEILPFSPLADEPPAPEADAVFLPGGYPELHAGRLAMARTFLDGLRRAAGQGLPVYGECGGYMVLGEGLADAEGVRHRMAGLLPLETSFAERRLHLGYRELRPRGPGPWDGPLAAHEFHYATVLSEGAGEPLFDAAEADGTPLPPMGRRAGSVMGSFAHVIARRESSAESGGTI
ncbi:cobyrinic acid a,c-diamide synthase [Minwuia thermotolerans]|uniref:Cobyrinate a,c-diamide synthase n=1 Tax=Minwuia thermotolerans TaxID=2056226 RepID=A0A2M9FZN4_9PROT|nr:cobyrinic acid a,c-diamide synthase [Minwuia thermotolerans]